MNREADGLPATPASSDPLARLKALEQEHAEQSRSLEYARALAAERANEIAALRGSLSWRLTAPLRGAGVLAQRLVVLPRAVRGLLDQYGGLRGLGAIALEVLRRDGIRGFLFRTGIVLRNAAGDGGFGAPGAPDPWGDATGEDLATRAKISVLIPAWNTPREMLDAAIWSVRKQTYPDWELCVVDDASPSPHVREVMQRHAAEDPRVKVAFHEKNGNISAALNTALGLATGDFMTVLDHDDLLHPKALYGVARMVSEHPEVDYVYSDEDKVSADGARYFGAFHKPGWSPEYLLTLMYTCHLGAYRMSIAKAIGGYRTEFDTAQDLDFTLRFLLRSKKVRHIPRVLYHWRVWEQSTAHSIDAKPQAEGRAREALRAYLEASGEHFELGPGPRPGHHGVRFLPRGEPLISIVIPTANGKIDIHGRTEWHLDEVTRTIFEKSTWRNYELVVIHNGNLRDEQVRALTARPNVKLVHYHAAKFSLAEKINQGCAEASGEYLVLMNDDIRVITPEWLELMLGMAQREGVGAVGPKLLFPDGTIQHAGVVLLGGCPGHAYYQWPGDTEGYALQAAVPRNCLAVTGACLMTAKRIYDEVGGFALRFPLNYNDVDFCLKLHERGYRSVYLPAAVLYHYEGVSKEGGRSVGIDELDNFLADWGDKFRHDPYYNPNLSQKAPYHF